MNTQWMIRSPQLQITGPFTKEELSSKILGGELSGDFEVCAGNHYWFYLNETHELEQQLGVKLPAHLVSTPVRNVDEVEGDITQDFPDESSQTSIVKNPAIKPAPLAPREHERATPPPMSHKSGPSSAIKFLFAVVVAIALFLIVKSR